MEKSASQVSKVHDFYLNIVIFSKDRPFQLRQLLKTLFRFALSQMVDSVVEGGQTILRLPLFYNIQLNVSVSVLYTFSQEKIYQPLYATL